MSQKSKINTSYSKWILIAFLALTLLLALFSYLNFNCIIGRTNWLTDWFFTDQCNRSYRPNSSVVTKDNQRLSIRGTTIELSGGGAVDLSFLVGVVGSSGATGVSGADGSSGINGSPGAIGPTGSTGAMGPVGPTGPSAPVPSACLPGEVLTSNGVNLVCTPSGSGGTLDDAYNFGGPAMGRVVNAQPQSALGLEIRTPYDTTNPFSYNTGLRVVGDGNGQNCLTCGVAFGKLDFGAGDFTAEIYSLDIDNFTSNTFGYQIYQPVAPGSEMFGIGLMSAGMQAGGTLNFYPDRASLGSDNGDVEISAQQIISLRSDSVDIQTNSQNILLTGRSIGNSPGNSAVVLRNLNWGYEVMDLCNGMIYYGYGCIKFTAGSAVDPNTNVMGVAGSLYIASHSSLTGNNALWVNTGTGLNNSQWVAIGGSGGSALKLYDENFSGSYMFAAPDATGRNAVAIGDGAVAQGDSGIAIGLGSAARGDYAAAIGFFNTADINSPDVFLIGSRNNAVNSQFLTVLGADNTVYGGNSNYIFGEGNSLSWGVQNSMVTGAGNAVGYNATGVSIVGNSNVVREDSSSISVVGSSNIVYIGNASSMTVGNSNTIGGSNSQSIYVIGEDNSTGDNVSNSFILGERNAILQNSSNALLLGNYNIVDQSIMGGAIGYANVTSGQSSYAIGVSNGVGANNSYAFGGNNNMSGTNAITALGINNDTPVANLGSNLIAVGHDNYMDSGDNQVSMGFLNSIRASGGMAFGHTNTIYLNATNSSIFGSGNAAEGANSILVGRNNYAANSFNDGIMFGSDNVSLSSGTFTLGVNNINNGQSSFVVGRDNLIDLFSSSNYLFGGSHLVFNSNNTFAFGQALSQSSVTNNMLFGTGVSTTDSNVIQFGQQGIAMTIQSIPTGGRVGIGTSSPEFKLDLNSDGGIIARGNYGSGTILTTSGAGSRLIWYPRKAAFRAGAVGATQWDDGGIGDYSVAFGQDTVASGAGASAFGVVTTASELASTALGFLTTASGWTSTAFGFQSTADGWVSTAFGNNTRASGISSTAFGTNTRALNDYAIAFGTNSIASGSGSTVFGVTTVANGTASTAFGQSTVASGSYATAFGNGTEASGLSSTSFGGGARATGDYSVAFGSNATASGWNSTAFGNQTIASGDYSTVFGSFMTLDTSATYSVGISLNSAVHTVSQANAMVVVGGNVGIGQLAPTGVATSDNLDVAGGIRVGTLASGTATNVCINGSGDLSACSSSRRYKENIQDLGLGLDTIRSLNAVSFDWEGTGEHDFGFIAEDVASVNALLATYNKDGQIQGVKYDQLTAILTNAIKEQQGQIDKVNDSLTSTGLRIDEISQTLIQLSQQLEDTVTKTHQNTVEIEKLRVQNQDLIDRLEKLETNKNNTP